MRSALAKVSGVENVDVQFGTKKVVITTSEEVDPEALVKAFEGTRFEATMPKK